MPIYSEVYQLVLNKQGLYLAHGLSAFRLPGGYQEEQYGHD